MWNRYSLGLPSLSPRAMTVQQPQGLVNPVFFRDALALLEECMATAKS
jgi:hypothetical protein